MSLQNFLSQSDQLAVRGQFSRGFRSDATAGAALPRAQLDLPVEGGGRFGPMQVYRLRNVHSTSLAMSMRAQRMRFSTQQWLAGAELTGPHHVAHANPVWPLEHRLYRKVSFSVVAR
jgi:hypothetical protein